MHIQLNSNSSASSMSCLICYVATQVAFFFKLNSLVFNDNSFLGIVFKVEEALAYKHRLQSAEPTLFNSCQLRQSFL